MVPQTARNIFVSMLFALVLGNSALILFAIFESRIYIAQPITSWLLALIVLITSWVDWSASFGEAENMAGIIPQYRSKEFAKLILDLAILYAYFFLFANINIDIDFSRASVSNLALPLFLIYLFYFFWDCFNYSKSPGQDAFSTYGPGAVCAGVVLVIWFGLAAYDSTSAAEERWVSMVATACLFGLVIFFRVLHSYRVRKRTVP